MSRWQNKRKAVRETDAEMAELFPLQEKRSSHQQQPSETVNHPLSLQEISCGGLYDEAEVSLTPIPPIAVDTQQSQSTLDPNITSSSIVHNKVLITEEEFESSTDSASDSFGSSYDKETNEVHSTVYLPLLSVAFFLGSRLTKTALSKHLKILQMASAYDCIEHSSVHMLMSKYKHLKFETTKIWVCYHPNCNSILQTKKDIKENLEKPVKKQSCGHNYYEDQRKDCYVLVLPNKIAQHKYFKAINIPSFYFPTI